MNNRTLYHGDNLEFLKLVDTESVDLVYIDPPFNKGYNFTSTIGAEFKDNWSKDENIYKHSSIVLNFAKEAHSIGMYNYLCFLHPRLVELKRVLKKTGSIYVHCDWSANYYIRLLLDEVFGKNNFRNEIIYKCKSKGMTNQQKYINKIPQVSDSIYVYSKSSKHKMNKIYRQPANRPKFNKKDERGYYRLTHTLKSTHFTHASEGNHFTWNGINPKLGWDATKHTMDERFAAGKIDGNGNSKQYEHEYKGLLIDNLFVNEYAGIYVTNKLKYPTQKPIELLSKIIKISSNPGDVVLDCFSGSGTTLIAAEQLDRAWLGAELNEIGIQRTIDRMKAENVIQKDSGEETEHLIIKGHLELIKQDML